MHAQPAPCESEVSRTSVSGNATYLLSSGVSDRPFTDAQIDAAVEALSDPARFREAESEVARVAPQLQRILNLALSEGGWFGEAHDAQVLRAATTPDPDDRIVAVRTLLAEETRIGMMVGVAVGWELRNELLRQTGDE